MATVLRKRKLVNPARRRLSPKQIRFFGTKAQKAALKRSRAKRASSPTFKHRVRSKPAAKASVKRPSARRPRHNVSAIVTAGLNPHQEKNHMAAKKSTRRRSNASQSSTKTRRRTNAKKRTNPSSHRPRTKVITKYRYRAKSRRSAKSNPPRTSATSNLLMNSVAGAAGAVGSRWIPAFFLGAANKGPVGYVSNISAGLGLAWAAKKFVSRQAASYVLVGSGIALVLRMAQDLTPWGKALALSGFGDSGMGALMPSDYVSPPLYTGNGAQRLVPPSWRAPAAPAPQPAMAGMGRSGVGSSYNSSSYR